MISFVAAFESLSILQGELSGKKGLVPMNFVEEPSSTVVSETYIITHWVRVDLMMYLYRAT